MNTSNVDRHFSQRTTSVSTDPNGAMCAFDTRQRLLPVELSQSVGTLKTFYRSGYALPATAMANCPSRLDEAAPRSRGCTRTDDHGDSMRENLFSRRL